MAADPADLADPADPADPTAPDTGARVLLVGGGARSHALALALRQSPSVAQVVFAPGTSGLERRGWPTAPVASQDLKGLAEQAELGEFDLTLVGPNTPIVDGIVDVFEAQNLPIFGPDREAAKLEGSKVFARLLMNRLHITTPRFAICDTVPRAMHMAHSTQWARVFKADGIAYGKGVRVTTRASEAEAALHEVMYDNIYGLESKRIVVEERLEGVEVTVFSLTDGKQVHVLGHVRNYPRLHDDEAGPPTRGMGQVSPAPEIDDKMLQRIFDEVLQPTVEAMAERGTPLRGALFVDLMLCRGRPVVIDYNVRFGDPATQILLSRLSGDFYALLQACRGQGDLAQAVAAMAIDDRPRVSVVLTCAGYPERYERGAVIHLNEAPFEADPDLWLFEDAVRWVPSQQGQAERLETIGGRAYTIVAAADTIAEARSKAYGAIKYVRFEGRHYRGDIGADWP